MQEEEEIDNDLHLVIITSITPYGQFFFEVG